MLDWFTFTASRGELDYGKRMQVALRMPIWARIFFRTLSDPHISDAVRLLMLAHIPPQARHLIAHPLQMARNRSMSLFLAAALPTWTTVIMQRFLLSCSLQVLRCCHD